MKVLANEINENCERKRYFFAAGLIRETLGAWAGNEAMLCSDAIAMLNTYRNEEVTQ